MSLKRVVKYILLFLLPLVARAETPSLEFQVKAAFLVNFVKFIEWPSIGTNQPENICLAGSNPFGDSLVTLASQSGGEHPLNVRYLTLEGLSTELESCQLVYITNAGHELETRLTKLRANKPIITVSEENGEGLIRFVIVDGKVRFSIDNNKITSLGA